MSNSYWIGLDVGSRKTAVCIIDEAGTVVAEAEVETDATAIIEVIGGAALSGPATLAIEAGGFDHLARELKAKGQTVIVFEARQAHRFLEIRRNKSDANDARGLAELARLGRTVVSHVYQRNDECRRIRSQLRLRESLIRQRMIAENTIRMTLRANGVRLKEIYSADGVAPAYNAGLAGLSKPLAAGLREDLHPFATLARDLRRFLTQLDRRLNRTAREHPVCRRLMTVPGVGMVTALSYYSAIEDPARFSRTADIAAYLGLTPRIAQSGATRRGGRISKMGNTLTRSHLYSAANVLLVTSRKENALKDWGTGLRQRIGLPKARIAVARKLAVVLASIWHSGGSFVAYPARPLATSVPPA